MSSELLGLSIPAALQSMRKGDLSPAAYRQAFLDRIVAHDEAIHSFLRVSDSFDHPSSGPLHGLPIAVKDNIVATGMPTTCGSKMLREFVSPFDATAIARLKSAGAQILGKTNLDEYAMGSSTEHSAFGVTRNPWDRTRVAGGSSGGSAAAVAAGFAPVALGSETGGSVRQPAAFCGVLGLKPTYGRISRYGLVAFASSLDQIGIFTRSAADCAAVLPLIAGHDPLDSTSAHAPVGEPAAELAKGVKGMRVGVIREAVESLPDEIREDFESAVQRFREGGAVIEEVSIPTLRYAIAVYYIVANAEASANLSRFDGIRYGHRTTGAKTLKQIYAESRSEGFGPEVKRRIMLGTFALSSGYYDAYYGRAQAIRAMMKRDFERVFSTFDLLLTPTTPEPAFRIGEKTDDPLSMYLSDIFTAPANLVGVPALAVPSSMGKQNLPLSLQLIGPHFSEGRLLRAAHFFEEARGAFPAAPL